MLNEMENRCLFLWYSYHWAVRFIRFEWLAQKNPTGKNLNDFCAATLIKSEKKIVKHYENA